MGEDQADVVAAAAEHGVEGVADRTLEGASGEAAVGLHVSDHRLDGAASSQVALQRRGHAAALAGDEDVGRLHAVAAIAAVDEGAAGAGVGQDLHLLERLAQSVAVVGVAGHGAHADDEALPVRGRHRDFRAELVADPGLAFRDAVDLGLVQGVELALVLRLLPQQPVGEGDLALDPLPQGGVGHHVQLPLDVAHDPAGIALQPPEALAHALELAGVGVTADLAGQPRRQPGIALAQREPGLAGELDQAQARLLVEPRVGGVGDGLFHDGRVHDHRFGAALPDHAGLSPGLDRLGQQPLDALLADPPAPAGERGRVDRRAVLEEGLAAEMLIVRVLDPPGDQGLVREAVGMLEIEQARHEPRRGRWPARVRRE
jgi:hypothetical protein